MLHKGLILLRFVPENGKYNLGAQVLENKKLLLHLTFKFANSSAVLTKFGIYAFLHLQKEIIYNCSRTFVFIAH